MTENTMLAVAACAIAAAWTTRKVVQMALSYASSKRRDDARTAARREATP